MTVDDLISLMQDIMGSGYKVSRHSTPRPEPQIDVSPVPEQMDSDGNPYGVTFTATSKSLQETPEDRHKLVAAFWASVCDQDITAQIQRGRAGKKVR